ncbi:heavy metal translocatin [Rhizoclosmatium globosum]|uniref:P-type Cu(+) transporter n=1 Tax=Rhizoclosmatium globosum TaxID=329046 RepID=A0A1Y2C774_9FUNG|nr:heavy metal translocatin [Rhizoclosmatium globosum]|eukprot:ORY42796.1 heavy metal translocatin [Rhizoclosmatium globosum]
MGMTETTYYVSIESSDAFWADTLEDSLFSVSGIKEVSINEGSRMVAVTVEAGLGLETLVDLINGLGDSDDVVSNSNSNSNSKMRAVESTAAAFEAAKNLKDEEAAKALAERRLVQLNQSNQSNQLLSDSVLVAENKALDDDFADFAAWDEPVPTNDDDPFNDPFDDPFIDPAPAAAIDPPRSSKDKLPRDLPPRVSSDQTRNPLAQASITISESPALVPAPLVPTSEIALLEIEGMTCAACVNTIESNVGKVAGITSIKVSLLAQRAEIEYDPSILQKSQLPDLIEDMGFGATLLKQEVKGAVTLQIYGMTCASCSGTITQEVSKLDGVISVSINLLGNSGHFTFDKNVIGVRNIVEKIEDLGFDAHVQDGGTNSQLESLKRTKEIQHWRNAFWKAFMFAFPVSCFSMFLPKSFVNIRLFPGLYLGVLVQCLLTIPVQFGVGRPFYTSAYKAVKHGSYTMDVLIALGTTIAFVFSAYTMLRGVLLAVPEVPEVFFETSSSLITFIALGRYLENLAKGKTSNALAKLMSLAPSHAVLLTVDKSTGATTSERKIPSELIQPGDLIKIVPGERIAADGVVVFGASSVDESLVTGEFRAVHKKPSDLLIAGTINGTGMLHMRATRVGTDTTLSQILKLVSDAQTSKAPIQDLADQVASVFVPAIITLGIATYCFWAMVFLCSSFVPPGYMGDKFYLAVKLGISVIVVACPCALGLATPTAVMVGTGVGAQLGILIKGGGPLSVANRVTKIVFDKTGTLTMGKMGVMEHRQVKTGNEKVDSLGPAQFLGVVGTVEEASEHAIGKSLFRYCKDSVKASSFGFALHEFESVPGKGVMAVISNTMSVQFRVCIGNAGFLADQGCAVPKEDIQAIQEQEATGLTVVLVGIERLFCGTFALSDVLKPESKDAVAALRKLGLEVCMITGDQELTALAIAKQCGITEVHAGVSPAGKKTLVEQMQHDGDVVAMVGDGVNDSASIAQADVGIAVYGGTDVAIEAASIVLMREDMMQIVTALDLCRTIYRRIRFNFLWATGYNLMMVPMAMGLGLPWGRFLPPMFAGMAMSLSSVSVVVSSLLLRTYQKPHIVGEHEDDPVSSSGAARILESLNFDDEVNSASEGKGGVFSVGGLLHRLRGFASGRQYAQLESTSSV